MRWCDVDRADASGAARRASTSMPSSIERDVDDRPAALRRGRHRSAVAGILDRDRPIAEHVQKHRETVGGAAGDDHVLRAAGQSTRTGEIGRQLGAQVGDPGGIRIAARHAGHRDLAPGPTPACLVPRVDPWRAGVEAEETRRGRTRDRLGGRPWLRRDSRAQADLRDVGPGSASRGQPTLGDAAGRTPARPPPGRRRGHRPARGCWAAGRLGRVFPT